MEMTDSNELLSFLGLMRKAGRLVPGEENSRRTVRGGKAVLILLASDASPNAVKRAEGFSAAGSCPLMRLTVDRNALGDALGVAPFSIAAVTDSGFAAALRKKTEKLGCN